MPPDEQEPKAIGVWAVRAANTDGAVKVIHKHCETHAEGSRFWLLVAADLASDGFVRDMWYSKQLQ